MQEEGNTEMIKACFQPKVSDKALKIFDTINSYAQQSSIFISGFSTQFQAIDNLKLIKSAKIIRKINLKAYEKFIDMYSEGMKRLYNTKKEKKDG